MLKLKSNFIFKSESIFDIIVQDDLIVGITLFGFSFYNTQSTTQIKLPFYILSYTKVESKTSISHNISSPLFLYSLSLKKKEKFRLVE